MSLADELKKKQTVSHKKRYVLGVVGLLLVGGGIFFAVSGEQSKKEPEQQFSEYTVKEDSISIGVEGAGVVEGNDLVSLSFESNDRITEILKKPGDTVFPGDIIAKQDTTTLLLDLEKAKNALAQSQLSYRQKANPLSDEEILQLDKQLESDQLNYQEKLLQLEKELLTLEQTKQDAELKLQQLKEDEQELLSDDDVALKQKEEDKKMEQTLLALGNSFEDYLQGVDDFLYQGDVFLGITDINKAANDSFESALSLRNTAAKTEAIYYRRKLTVAMGALDPSYMDSDELLQKISSLASLQSDVDQLTEKLIEVVESSLIGTSWTEGDLKSYYSQFSNLGDTLRKEYNSLLSSKENFSLAQISSTSSLDSATDSLTDRKRTLEQQMEQAQISLENTLSSYALKKEELEMTKQRYVIDNQMIQIDYTIKANPLSDDEKSLYALQVESSQLSVDEKQRKLDNAILRSPITGTILAIDGAVGEISSQGFVNLVSEGEKYISVSIEEEEVALIEKGQRVIISPDVFEGMELSGTVAFVSPLGETDNNGIVSYEVVIYFEQEDRLKSSMNVSVSFVAQEAKDVVVVPVAAVFPYENTAHVRMSDGTLRQVVSGLSDGKEVEIISGLEAGERILLQK